MSAVISKRNLCTEALTVDRKTNEEKHAGLQRNYVHKEVPLVVRPNTVVNPWAVALEGKHTKATYLRYLLIMFRHATATSFAVLTPKGPSDHAGYTEVLVIEFPQAQ